jgi:hypothetical protein
MKPKLLFLFAVLFLSLPSFGQATATQPPSLTQCNFEVFDLTAQTPIILGAQDPESFTVTYFMSSADAAANANPIVDPSVFVPNGQAAFLYARVDNLTDGSFAITNFWVTWFSVWVPEISDVTVCDSYTLPALQSGNYYTAPGGTGVQMPAGTAIASSQVVYVYDWLETCSAESSFTVTVVDVPELPVFEDVYSCEPYVLPALPNGFMYFDATGSVIPMPTTIPQNATLTVGGGTEACVASTTFNVFVGPPVFGFTAPYVICNPDGGPFDVFNLPWFTQMFTANMPYANFTYHLTLADAENNTNPIANPAAFANTVPSEQTIYVRGFYDGADCATIAGLVLHVVFCTENIISGNLRFDYDNNGCSPSDPPASGVPVMCTNGNLTTYAYTNADGNYTLTNIQQGNNLVTPVTVPMNFTVGTPSSQTFDVLGSTNELTADFCLLVANPLTDVSVQFYPANAARPGLPAYYMLQVSNIGTLSAMGTVTLQYDASKLTFANSNAAPSSTTANTITFNYGPLLPMQGTSFALTFNVAIPPTANAGEVLIFDADAITVGTDVDMANNSADLSQTLVNSLDPNDIMVLEGAYISAEQADGWLNYIIRFQNTGTAEAINIRIENKLDGNLDWSTFTPMASSHTFQAQRTSDDVTFRFNGINLPAASQNELASHGFVTYKIKPVADFSEGEIIAANAQIFFDFNAPITTNTVTTQIQSLGVNENTDGAFVMYPNPASEILNVKVSSSVLDISVYDVLGKQVFKDRATANEGTAAIDVSSLSPGLYLIRMESDGKTAVKKLVVK